MSDTLITGLNATNFKYTAIFSSFNMIEDRSQNNNPATNLGFSENWN